MLRKDYSKIIFAALLLLGLFLSYQVIKPYILTLLTAFVLTLLFYPLYGWLKRKLKNKYVSATIVVIIILLIATVPFVFLIKSLISEVDSTIETGKLIAANNLFDCDVSNNALCNLYDSAKEIYPDLDLSAGISTIAKKLLAILSGTAKTFTTGIFNFIISLYIVFFLFLDGHKLVEFVKKSLALKKTHERYILKTLKDTTIAIVFGNIITAMIQGIVAALGYWLIGGLSGTAILLGVFTAFFALIPGIGSGLVWFPTGIYLVLSGLFISEGNLLLRGILLLAYGALVISTIDNLIKPKIIGKRANIHPAVVFIGVIGGLQFTNSILGVIVGPLILGTFIKMLELLKAERKNL